MRLEPKPGNRKKFRGIGKRKENHSLAIGPYLRLLLFLAVGGGLLNFHSTLHMFPESEKELYAPQIQATINVSLSHESLIHIKKAGLVDLSYINVSGNLTQHPHKGALDEYGQPGYVYDVTTLRKNPPPLSWSNSTKFKECQKNNISSPDRHFPAIQRLKIGPLDSRREFRPSRILCAIYTSSKSHKNVTKLRETWAPQCDGFFAASDKTDKAFDAVNVLHSGPESYKNMWQKVRSIWAYIYDNYYMDYDWFHIGGDDMWLIVENLRAYLDSDEIRAVSNGGMLTSTLISQGQQQQQVPMYLGCRFALEGNVRKLFNTGGPGYTLNRAALKLLVVEGLPRYFTTKNEFFEDVFVGQIFQNLNVSVYNTRDEMGSERYMHFTPEQTYYSEEMSFYRKYTRPLKPIVGPNHASVHSLAFHYINDANEMRRFHSTLHGICD